MSATRVSEAPGGALARDRLAADLMTVHMSQVVQGGGVSATRVSEAPGGALARDRLAADMVTVHMSEAVQGGRR